MTLRENRSRADFWPPVSEPPELPPDPAREARIEGRRLLLAEQATVVEALALAYQDANQAAAQRAKRRKVKRGLLQWSRVLPRRLA